MATTSELTDTSLNIAGTTTINGIESTLSNNSSKVATSSAILTAINNSASNVSSYVDSQISGTINNFGMIDDTNHTLLDFTDANTINKTCLGYAYNCDNLPSDAPSKFGYLTTIYANSNFIKQIFTPYNSNETWTRVKNESWGSWALVSGNSDTVSIKNWYNNSAFYAFDYAYYVIKGGWCQLHMDFVPRSSDGSYRSLLASGRTVPRPAGGSFYFKIPGPSENFPIVCINSSGAVEVSNTSANYSYFFSTAYPIKY